jgi:hypothetical protein
MPINSVPKPLMTKDFKGVTKITFLCLGVSL